MEQIIWEWKEEKGSTLGKYFECVIKKRKMNLLREKENKRIKQKKARKRRKKKWRGGKKNLRIREKVEEKQRN